MAISWTGIEGLGTRLARVLGGINEVNNFRYNTENTRVSTIISGYPFTDQIAIDNIITERDQYRVSSNTWLQNLQDVGVTTLISQVNDEIPLTSYNLQTALETLVINMQDNNQAFARPTCTSAVSAASGNYGNGQIVTSFLDGQGRSLDLVVQENMVATVTNDAGNGAVAFQEPIQILGLPQADGLSFNWPQGSGANQNLLFADGTQTTLVSNGGYDTWTSPSTPPDGWTIGTGSAGTTVIRSATNYRGTYSLQFAGNGSELTSTYQDVTTNMRPNTVYCYNLWAIRSAGAAAGVLRVRLADGTGATINNDQSVANSTSVTVSSGLNNSTWTKVTVFFQTPRILPAAVRVYIDLTTAITNGQTVNVDLGSFVTGIALYPTGPYAAAFSGSVQNATDDRYTIANTNSQDGSNFLPGLARIFAPVANGSVYLPSTLGTPVVPDNYISPTQQTP